MIKSFLIGSTLMLILDYLWLSFIAKSFFMTQIGHVMNIENGILKINYMAALIVYLVLMLGLLVFVMPKVTSLITAIFYGALFGFIIYAIYDFTNLATLKDWPLIMCLVDVTWGAFLCSMTTLSIYYFCRG